MVFVNNLQLNFLSSFVLSFVATIPIHHQQSYEALALGHCQPLTAVRAFNI